MKSHRKDRVKCRGEFSAEHLQKAKMNVAATGAERLRKED